jgi:hypothetical protein
MDLCHCPNPAPEKQPGSNMLLCLNCRMYYDEDAWSRDSRVKRAILESRKFSKEQQKLIDDLMSQAEQE